MNRLWPLVSLLISAGCGSIEPSQVKTSDGLRTDFSCEDSTEEYSRLVASKNYQKAAAYVCEKFSLGCQGKKIQFKAQKTGYAYTNALTDQITLLPKAFHYPYCDDPHEGWLASVIGHEIVHTNQDRATRWWAAKFSRKKTAILEIEGWQYMWRLKDRFKLNTRMRIEIESQIAEYRNDLL